MTRRTPIIQRTILLTRCFFFLLLVSVIKTVIYVDYRLNFAREEKYKYNSIISTLFANTASSMKINTRLLNIRVRYFSGNICFNSTIALFIWSSLMNPRRGRSRSKITKTTREVSRQNIIAITQSNLFLPTNI